MTTTVAYTRVRLDTNSAGAHGGHGHVINWGLEGANAGNSTSKKTKPTEAKLQIITSEGRRLGKGTPSSTTPVPKSRKSDVVKPIRSSNEYSHSPSVRALQNPKVGSSSGYSAAGPSSTSNRQDLKVRSSAGGEDSKSKAETSSRERSKVTVTTKMASENSSKKGPGMKRIVKNAQVKTGSNGLRFDGYSYAHETGQSNILNLSSQSIENPQSPAIALAERQPRRPGARGAVVVAQTPDDLHNIMANFKNIRQRQRRNSGDASGNSDAQAENEQMEISNIDGGEFPEDSLNDSLMCALSQALEHQQDNAIPGPSNVLSDKKENKAVVNPSYPITSTPITNNTLANKENDVTPTSTRTRTRSRKEPPNTSVNLFEDSQNGIEEENESNPSKLLKFDMDESPIKPLGKESAAGVPDVVGEFDDDGEDSVFSQVVIPYTQEHRSPLHIASTETSSEIFNDEKSTMLVSKEEDNCDEDDSKALDSMLDLDTDATNCLEHMKEMQMDCEKSPAKKPKRRTPVAGPNNLLRKKASSPPPSSSRDSFMETPKSSQMTQQPRRVGLSRRAKRN